MGPSTGAFIVSFGLVAWAAVMRAVTGTWLQPSAFFPLFWCAAGILPMVFAPQDRVSSTAVLWLIGASMAISIGGVAGNRGFKSKLNSAYSAPTDRELSLFSWAAVAALVLGLGSSLAFAIGSGIPLSTVLHIEQLVVVSNQVYFSRYAEGGAVSPPALSRALLPFVYLAPAIGGILFVLTRRWGLKVLSLLSFLPAIAVTILQTTKAAFLFALVLWLSGYFATRLRFGRIAVFTRPHLLVAIAGVAAVSIFFFAVSLARLASSDIGLANVVLLKLVTSAFGHMTVFSQWLAEYLQSPFSPSLGRVTFAGPLEMLGYGERIPGLFEGVINLIAGETSNVYTGFRPLIQDFTIPGALAVLLALGFVGGIGFRHVAAGRWSALPLLMIAYATIFWTPITWFWIYNSLTATVVAVATLVWFIRVWRGAAKSRLEEERAGTG